MKRYTMKLKALLRCTRLLALLLALAIPGLSGAQESLLGLPSNESSSNAYDNLLTSDTQPEFLQVTEAYQLETSLNNSVLTLSWVIAPDYYLYEERFKFEPIPKALFSTNNIQPTFSESKVKYDEYFEKDMAVFYHKASITLDLANIKQSFSLRVESQGCADAGLCYPPYSDYLYIDIDAQQVFTSNADSFVAQDTDTSLEEAAPQGSWQIKILLFAILGGLILNLMPCVFPVLSIKVLSLAHADSERLPQHGWVYMLGVILSFLAFGVLLIVAKSSGESIGWGFQLQSPSLIGVLVFLFLLLGLNLSGVLNLGGGWSGAGQGLTEKSGLMGSFFTGILAAVVASPCTAPFMGVAMGYALTQPAAVALSVFVALGFGMALPLLVLCYMPKLIQHLPNPGVWMDILKQVLAFPLYLTSLWLFWVLGREAGSDAMAILLLGVLLAAFALWLWHLQCNHGFTKALKFLLMFGALLLALASPFLTSATKSEMSERWQPYTPEKLAELRSEGRGVFVNLTADWCITCLANERITLGTDVIEAAFDEHDIATLKGDWTHRDDNITQLLEEYKRSGVPLYLWFPPNTDGPAKILPQLLRKKHLLEAFQAEYGK